MDARLASVPANMDRDEGRTQLCASCWVQRLLVKRPRREEEMDMIRRMVRMAWASQAVDEVGLVDQEVEICQITGTAGVRVMSVRVMDRRPSLETPVIWLAVEGPFSLESKSSSMLNVEREGGVGISVLMFSDRG